MKSFPIHTFFTAPFLAGVIFFGEVDGFLAVVIFLLVVVFFTGFFFATDVYFLVVVGLVVVVFAAVASLDVPVNRLVVFFIAEGFDMPALGFVVAGLLAADLLDTGLAFLEKRSVNEASPGIGYAYLFGGVHTSLWS